MTLNPAWPVLTNYEGRHLRRVAMPLGGIGTGTVSLGGRGDLRDWEIMNRPAKGFAPGRHAGGIAETAPFFALWTKTANGNVQTRCLEGPVPLEDYEGSHGTSGQGFYGLPRFAETRFACAYPLAQIQFQDPSVPLEVRLEAFNPLIPGDADASSYPVAIFRWILTNPTDSPIHASISGNLPNFVGRGASKSRVLSVGGRNRFKTDSLLSGVLLDTPNLWPLDEENGSLALALVDADGLAISHQEDWSKRRWSGSLLDFWDDFSEDGVLEPRPSSDDAWMASLAGRCEVGPDETRSLTFILAWHFPNRKVWWPQPFDGVGDEDPNQVGNYYATQFSNAWDAATCCAARLHELEAQTVRFVSAFCQSDWPAEVKEAALYNLSTLRSETTFRIPEGYLMGWEGCEDNHGSCHGSCTHVWNYETALGFLFGDLSRSMREIEFLHATHEDGLMSFRAGLPLSKSREMRGAAADGQMGTLMRLYRDWSLFGDEAWLKKMWPQAKKALEFCWLPSGWDADQDGVMEGCQHNTMDVEYFGPNPQMGFWYLGALRACETMARHVGEAEFADRCRALFENGSAWLDAHLFKGGYYQQEIRPIVDPGSILEGLAVDLRRETWKAEPDLQIGAGCLVDQLVGQYMAHVCGLGHLGDPEKIQTALQSVLEFNWREPMKDHFNHMRTYAQGEEAALIMCSYPHGERPTQPFPYYGEVMTGFEYTAAAGAIYEGDVEGGLKVIRAIRARYDGHKRSPFNEAECGHHYARALASWTATLALSGFHFSAIEKTMKFRAADKQTTWFWSNGSAWGTFFQSPERSYFRLDVLFGEVDLSAMHIGEAVFALDSPRTFKAGDHFSPEQLTS